MQYNEQTNCVVGPLYRRVVPYEYFSTKRRHKSAEWTPVMGQLALTKGELRIFQDPQMTRQVVCVDLLASEISHVRSDGRESIELSFKPLSSSLSSSSSSGSVGSSGMSSSASKKTSEILTAQESSYDVDWWMNLLLMTKRDLKRGVTPQMPLVCPPAQPMPTPPKSSQGSRRTPPSPPKPNPNAPPTSSAPASSSFLSAAADDLAVTSSPPSSCGSSASRASLLKRRQPILESNANRFERFTIYETETTYYVVSSDRHYSRFRYFQLDRTIDQPENLKQIMLEDTNLYNWEQMEEILQRIATQVRAEGKGHMQRAFTAVAIVGCVRFLRGYYFTFVTQRRKIGCIGGNFIYGIQATQQLTVSRASEDGSVWTWLNRWFNPSPEEEAEARYLGLFHFIDLTKDFFYSYSYDVTHTLQHNMTTDHSEPSEMFTWNHYLTSEFKSCLTVEAAENLVVPIVLGCYEQRKCSVFGRLISIILLARRSRHYAGTRYLKRGVADTGQAANDVETEQIIEDESMGVGKFSSFVQHRGSIPVFWSQETSATLPKPPIVLNRIDPTYTATRKHMAQLFARYGSPIVALNLVKHSEKKQREVVVGTEYMNAVEYLNDFIPPEHRIRYIALDYSRLSKQKGLNVLHSLDKVAVWALTQTGFFCSHPKRLVGKTLKKGHTKEENILDRAELVSCPPVDRNITEWLEQNGVLRTNCIDCLDRTNVSQFSVGMRALGQQLYAMGIRNTPLLESRSQLVRVLMLLYSLVGDAISMQYGGSEAHKNVKNSTGRENVKHRELLTSIRRYYSNSFTDMAKQDAINIFLGHFVPKPSEPPLWELESDYYLHNFEVKKNQEPLQPYEKHTIAPSIAMSTTSSVVSMPLLANVASPVVAPNAQFDDLLHDATEPAITPIAGEGSNKRESIEEEGDEDSAEAIFVRAMLGESKPDTRRQKRTKQEREKYIQECKRMLEDWWKDPLAEFDLLKYSLRKQRPRGRSSLTDSFASDEVSIPRSSQSMAGRKSLSNCSESFLQIYQPAELTSFDKALGYKFMAPMELVSESSSDYDSAPSSRNRGSSWTRGGRGANVATGEPESRGASSALAKIDELAPSMRSVSIESADVFLSSRNVDSGLRIPEYGSSSGNTPLSGNVMTPLAVAFAAGAAAGTAMTPTSSGIPTRSGRSMSAPDISEDIDRMEAAAAALKKPRDKSAVIEQRHQQNAQHHANYLMQTQLEPLSGSGTGSGKRREANGSLVLYQQSSLHPDVLPTNAPLNIEEYANHRGVGLATNPSQSHRKMMNEFAKTNVESIYERYVHWNRTPSLWEAENESVRSYFEAYLRDLQIDPDDVRSVQDAQVRGGATFKIQSGTYAGLDQHVKARVLVAKKIKTDPEDRRIFEDSSDMKKLTSSGKLSIPSDSLELYKSFFHDKLPEVPTISPTQVSVNSSLSYGSTSSSFASMVANSANSSLAALQLAQDFRKMSMLKSFNTSKHSATSDLISVGRLFKLEGGKDHEFILFNESAAENGFCQVIRNETELSFYTK